MRRKRYAMLMLCIFAVSQFVLSLPAGAKDISVTIDGANVQFTDAKPFIDESNRTMVPLRVLSEEMGYGVIWEPISRSVYVFDVREKGTELRCLNFVIDSTEVFILNAKGSGFSANDDLITIESKITNNGDVSTFEMDTEAVITQNRTYIPLRYVATLMGKNVTWHQDTLTVEIN